MTEAKKPKREFQGREGEQQISGLGKAVARARDTGQ